MKVLAKCIDQDDTGIRILSNTNSLLIRVCVCEICIRDTIMVLKQDNRPTIVLTICLFSFYLLITN